MKKTFLTLFAIFAVALCALGLTACKSVTIGGIYTYSNAQLYTAGGGSAEGVNAIDIDWVSGSVNIQTADVDAVVFSEETSETDDEYQMRWYVVGGVLNIKYIKSGSVVKNLMNKVLTVTVPANGSFTKIEVENVSGGVAIDGISADEIDVEAVSGSITVENVVCNELDLDTVSGSDTVSSTRAVSANIESTSGSVSVTDCDVTELELDSTSGVVNVENVVSLRSLEIETTSGRISVDLDAPAPNTEIDTTSGKVDLTFGENAAFNLVYRTVSGTISNEFSATAVGGAFTVNGGGANVVVDTTSGSLTVNKK